MKDEFDKLKKLLALASSPNKNEAKLALEKAQELAQKLGMPTLGTLEFRTYEFPRATVGMRPRLSTIVCAVAPVFGVPVAFNRKKEILFFCTEDQMQIATYACDCILSQGLADWKEEFRKQRSAAFDFAFWEAFADRIWERFYPLRKIDPLIEREFSARTAITGSYEPSSSSDSADGAAAGTSAGNSAQYRPGMDAPKRNGGLLE